MFADIGYPIDGMGANLAELSIFNIGKKIQLGINIEAPVLTGALKKIEPDILWLSGKDPQNKVKSLKSKLKET